MTGGPLKGIHVLDLSRVLAAPYATMALGELGADVIKIERRPGGDETRQWGPPFFEGESAYFLSINRNKRSIALDLGREDDQARVRDLALHWADVLVENFKPGTLERWHLSLSDLRRQNPRLITATVRGYPEGDDRPGYDFVIQAGSGLMSVTGPAEGDPYKVGVAVSDMTTGLFLLSGIEAALYSREVTGRGDHVSVSLWASQLAALTNVAQSYLVTGKTPKRWGNAHAQLAPYQIFRTQNGWLAIAVGNDRQFRALCQALEHPEWIEDVRFMTNPDRVVHQKTLAGLIEGALGGRSTEEWVRFLEKANIPAGPVRTIPEALEDATTRGHGLVDTVTHQSFGKIGQVRLPWRFAESPVSMNAPPPTLDQDREEILQLIEQIRTREGRDRQHE